MRTRRVLRVVEHADLAHAEAVETLAPWNAAPRASASSPLRWRPSSAGPTCSSGPRRSPGASPGSSAPPPPMI